MDAVKSKSQVFEEMGKIDPLIFFLIVSIIVLVVLAILIWSYYTTSDAGRFLRILYKNIFGGRKKWKK